MNEIFTDVSPNTMNSAELYANLASICQCVFFIFIKDKNIEATPTKFYGFAGIFVNFFSHNFTKWIVDIGAISYICCNMSLFTEHTSGSHIHPVLLPDESQQ